MSLSGSLHPFRIAAAVSACRRIEALQKTLEVLHRCDPLPDEILVHIDGNSEEIRLLMETHFPEVRVLQSEKFIGPGGARNRLNRASSCPWIAHFDDDSYPLDLNFFATASRLVQSPPEVAVWCATIESHERPLEPGKLLLQAVFPGCGHIMNQSWFLKTKGYQERPIAYNLEEVDVSLQLSEKGGTCVQSADLRVWHDHPTPLREPPEVETEIMLNTLLFPVIRFPLSMIPQALLSILRRSCLLALKPGGLRVLSQTLMRLPSEVRRLLPEREPVSFPTVLSWLRLRRHPVLVSIT
jgi:GT2 family glycosyltransferase